LYSVACSSVIVIIITDYSTRPRVCLP